MNANKSPRFAICVDRRSGSERDSPAMAVGNRHAALALVAFALLAGGCRKKSPTEAHFRLDTGLRVDLYATSRGEKAALALLFDVGADHDPPGRSGMAHLVEHLLVTSGRAGKPGRTID